MTRLWKLDLRAWVGDEAAKRPDQQETAEDDLLTPVSFLPLDLLGGASYYALLYTKRADSLQQKVKK